MAFDKGYEVFNDLADLHLAALQAGAPFPDFLYACGDEHDAGEEAHWEPFQMAAADYIRDVYPHWDKRLDGQGARVVTFMMGVVSHYITDINWHGLENVPSGEGLIRQMGIANFNCSGDLCDSAHTAADTGGEFVASMDLDLSWYPNRTWYVPVQDLVNIYAVANESGYGPTVEPEWIRECSLLFYVGSFFNAKLGWLLYPTFVSDAPFLAEWFEHFWLGGIDDDALWTAAMYNRWASWVMEGPPEAESERVRGKRTARNFRSLARESIRRLKHALTAAEDGKLRVGPFEGVLMEGGAWELHLANSFDNAEAIYDLARLYFGSDMLANAKQEQLVKKQIELALEGGDVRNIDLSAVDEPKAVYQGEQSREYFGYSLAGADLNGDGCDDIVIGAPNFGYEGRPQAGRVEIQWGCSKGRSVVNGTTDGRLGHAISIGDVNGDGHLDLCIASPTFGALNVSAVVGNYTGRVDIFLGPVRPSAHMSQDHADITIYGNQRFGTFGFSLLIGDVNEDGVDDLIVGSPFSGKDDASETDSNGCVHIFSGAWSRFMSADEAAQTRICGRDRFGWFGYHISLFNDDGNRYMLIGAPIYQVEGQGAPGRVYGFVAQSLLNVRTASLELLAEDSALFSITGYQHAAKTGHVTVAIPTATGTALLIASPTYSDSSSTHHSGQIAYVPFSVVRGGGDWVLDDLLASPEATFINGAGKYSRLGWAMRVEENEVLVSAPFSSSEDGMRGKVYSLRTEDQVLVLDELVSGASSSSRLGWGGVLLLDVDGDGIKECVCAAHRDGSTLEKELTGAVFVYAV